MRCAAASAARQIVQQAAARQQRQPALRQLARRVLEAEVAHLRGRGPDERDAGRFACLGESGVLGQEAVAGMDGLGAACARGVEDALAAADNSRRRARGRRNTPRRPARTCGAFSSASEYTATERDAHGLHACAGCGRRSRRDWRSVFSRNIAQNHPRGLRQVVPAWRSRDGSSRRWERAFMRVPGHDADTAASGCRRCRDC